MSPQINVRRPMIYLVIAAILAAVALVAMRVPADGETTPAQPTPGAEQSEDQPAADTCTDVVGSLRPDPVAPAPGAMPAGSTMATIAARGRLVVGVNQGNYLLGFRDPQTREFRGAEVDLARTITTAIFGSAEPVEFVALDVADREGAIESGRVDMVISAYSITCARQRVVEFSTVYMRAAQRLLVEAGSDIRSVTDLAGRRACTSAASVNEEILHRQATAVEVETWPIVSDCVVELMSNRVDAVSSDDVILAGMTALDPQLVVVGEPMAATDFGIGVAKQSPDLVRFVNGILERERANGQLQAIYSRWFGDYGPIPEPGAAVYRD